MPLELWRACGTSARPLPANKQETTMLRCFAAFLLLFWLLGLSVHLDGVVHAFALAALVLFALDLLRKSPRPSRVRGEPLL